MTTADRITADLQQAPEVCRHCRQHVWSDDGLIFDATAYAPRGEFEPVDRDAWDCPANDGGPHDPIL